MRLEENQLNTERKIIQYGITIVQINPSDMILWRELLNQLEREPERQQNLLRIERALETRIRNLPRGSFRAVTGTDKNY
jgi:glucose-6-phosphate dehydrogenase assembly protein OpcA